MKILLFFTFYLISGHVSCSDVIGYSGGDVIIYCRKPENKGYIMYFCKESAHQCVYPESDSSLNTWDHKGRVSVGEIAGFLTVIYRDLTLQDTGLYQCGGTGVWSITLNLNVKTDKCCSGPKTVTSRPGETVTISCSYPEEFNEKAKFISTLKDLVLTEIAHTSDPLKRRFSTSEDRRSKIVSMRISDVTKGDERVYYCGVSGDRGAVSYETFFTKIHLQITAPGSSTTIIIIISVSICVVLLLIGGLILIFYKLRCSRTGDSAHISQTSGTNDTNDCDYENDPPRLRNDISMIPLHQNMDHSVDPNTKKSDSVYQKLNPRTREPESIYYSLKPNRK